MNEPPRRTLLGVTPHAHAHEQLRCQECGFVTDWFRGWSFTKGACSGIRPEPGGTYRAGVMQHDWVLEAKPDA